jgi:hypothetical protein
LTTKTDNQSDNAAAAQSAVTTASSRSRMPMLARLAQGSQGARAATRRLLGTVCPTPCDGRCHSAIPDSPDWSMDLAGRATLLIAGGVGSALIHSRDRTGPWPS